MVTGEHENSNNLLWEWGLQDDSISPNKDFSTPFSINSLQTEIHTHTHKVYFYKAVVSSTRWTWAQQSMLWLKFYFSKLVWCMTIPLACFVHKALRSSGLPTKIPAQANGWWERLQVFYHCFPSEWPLFKEVGNISQNCALYICASAFRGWHNSNLKRSNLKTKA